MREIPAVQNPVSAYARSLGWKVRRMEYLGRHGCPDSWFFKNGRLIIVEFKAEGKPLELHQEREVARLRSAGMEVHVIDRAEDGYALFE